MQLKHKSFERMWIHIYNFCSVAPYRYKFLNTKSHPMEEFAFNIQPHVPYVMLPISSILKCIRYKVHQKVTVTQTFSLKFIIQMRIYETK